MKDIFFQTELAELAAAEERSKLNNFLKTEKNIVSAPVKAFKSGVFFICVLSILGFKTQTYLDRRRLM